MLIALFLFVTLLTSLFLCTFFLCRPYCPRKNHFAFNTPALYRLTVLWNKSTIEMIPTCAPWTSKIYVPGLPVKNYSRMWCHRYPLKISPIGSCTGF